MGRSYISEQYKTSEYTDIEDVGVTAMCFFPLVTDPWVFTRAVAPEGAHNNREVEKGKTPELLDTLCSIAQKTSSLLCTCVVRYAECQVPVVGCIKRRMANGNGVMMSWMKKVKRAERPWLPCGWDEPASCFAPSHALGNAFGTRWMSCQSDVWTVTHVCAAACVCPLSLHWVSRVCVCVCVCSVWRPAEEQQVKPVSATRRQVRFAYPLELPTSRVVHLPPQYRWRSPNKEGLSLHMLAREHETAIEGRKHLVGWNNLYC